jgi:RecA-family ATPase
MTQPRLPLSVGEAAVSYIRLGWVLVAFDRGLKGPLHHGWNIRENCIADAARAANLFGNVGLCHAYSGTVCIDIDDLAAAIEVFAGRGIDIMEYWNAPNAVRISSGRENRGKLLFKLPPGVHWLPTKLFFKWGFELRCASATGRTVQDVLPPSIHPKTGEPYTWEGGGSITDLPTLPTDILEWWVELTAKSERGEVQPLGVGRADLEQWLERIDPAALGYGDWLNIGLALHHETGGADDGLMLWDQWSSRGGDKYLGIDELEAKWPGFHVKHENPRTIATIRRMAEDLDAESEFAADIDALSELPDLPNDSVPAPIAPRAAAVPPVDYSYSASLPAAVIDDVEALPDLPDLPGAVDSKAAPAAGAVPVADGVEKKRLLRAEPVKLAALLCVPPAPEVIVENLLLMDACGFVAPGGTGKTTLGIFEAVHIILGKPLWGRQILRPGKILFLTAEDSRQILETRLNQICQAMGLTDAELQVVADGFYIEDLSMVSTRLVGTDMKGAVKPTKLVGAITDLYKPLGISLVHLDPASLLGPGEQSGNDGMSELMRAARQIAAAVRSCCQIVHHVAQAVARGGIQDQYAGRGGTAFADNSRGQRQLIRIKERLYEFNNIRYRLPDAITDEMIERGRILAILVHKLSYVELDPHPIFIRRDGFAFHQFEADVLDAKRKMTTDEEVQVIAGFIEKELANGKYHSRNSLEARSKDIGMTQKRIRDLVDDGISNLVFGMATTPKMPGRGGIREHLIVLDDLGAL